MMHVSILVPHEAVMASIVDPRTMFAGVNDFWKRLVNLDYSMCS
ncbi:MAG: hypothetical protein WKG06_29215 [Segetibacter sp.]